MIKFLDCTLRDGGYYNDWDFDLTKAEQLIASLNEAGVDIIELGYKSPANTQKYFGLFKNCNEDYLRFLSKEDSADYAFMIDVKEFITNDLIDYAELDKEIKKAEDSIFSWVRLASHYATISFIPDFVLYFRNKGYKIGFNLMGGSLLSDDQLLSGLNKAKEAEIDVFYIADSFGSFYPKDIKRIIRFIKSNYSGIIGVHTHDNQGMAYANTLAAIEEGVQFVDGTVTGMGRGAGNLHTEQFLLGQSIRNEDGKYDSSALLHVIENYIQPLKNQHKWGYNTSYMYSGLLNIHPTYGQELSSSRRFTSSEIASILTEIPVEFRRKYNPQALNDVIRQKLSIVPDSVNDVPEFNLEELKSEAIIILAKGPEAKSHVPSIKGLSNKLNIPILECNYTGYLEDEYPRTTVILNQLKLREWTETVSESSAVKVVTGSRFEDTVMTNMFHYHVDLGDFYAEIGSIQIPDYNAGYYAIALAIAAGAKKVYLAGFDGFVESDANTRNQSYLKSIKSFAEKKGVRIVHITRSNYQVFDQQSLYIL